MKTVGFMKCLVLLLGLIGTVRTAGAYAPLHQRNGTHRGLQTCLTDNALTVWSVPSVPIPWAGGNPSPSQGNWKYGYTSKSLAAYAVQEHYTL
jgi:hypothetical protein